MAVATACIWMVACNVSDEGTTVSKNSKSQKLKPAGKTETALQEQEYKDLTPESDAASNAPADSSLATANMPDDITTATTTHSGEKTPGANGHAATIKKDLGNGVNLAEQEADNPMRATASRDKASGSPANKAVMTFENTSYDFGSIVTGAKVQHEFKFTNTGAAPLIIHDANSSCGCTIPQIPMEPIAPGETSSILVKYDSTGKIGSQTKTVTIQTNASPATYHVVLKGLVLTENMLKEEEPKETGE